MRLKNAVEECGEPWGATPKVPAGRCALLASRLLLLLQAAILDGEGPRLAVLLVVGGQASAPLDHLTWGSWPWWKKSTQPTTKSTMPSAACIA